MLKGKNITFKKYNMTLSKDIAACLVDKEAVRVSIDPPFTWASGIKSPVYCDNRKMLGFVGDRERIVDGYIKLIEDNGLEYDTIAGTATAGIPWAALIAAKLHKPMVYIRPEKKAHGAGKQIEGFYAEGSKMLVIEDLISTGGSSVKAVMAVRESGCTVDDVLAIVTWEIPKSKTVFAEANLNLFTMTDYTNIIGLAAETGSIPEDKLESVLQFKEDPASWGEKMGF
jgi:orotate phosphoribosyltransferase